MQKQYQIVEEQKEQIRSLEERLLRLETLLGGGK